VTIHDLTGRKIRTLIAGEPFEPGKHEMAWDGRSDGGAIAGSGVYFIRLRAANQQQVLKILLMK
jgi:flagellar hook assembly protein FlgD